MSNGGTFQALALTGGGYRGLFTAQVLQVLEGANEGKLIGERFDLVCGTSIGGIIALAVAFDVPMEKVVKVFLEEGERIFPQHGRRRFKPWDTFLHWRKPRYDAGRLREAVEHLLKGFKLEDARHPVAVPAVNVTTGQMQVFKSRYRQCFTRDLHFDAVDVALATAAAPTFFELAEVDGCLYADGGLYANAPDLIALHEAEQLSRDAGLPCEQRVLSIGTTTKNYSISFKAGRRFGIGDWMKDDRLFSMIISSQQQFVVNHMRHTLNNNYFRIDYEPSQAQAEDLGLDRATAPARNTMRALGQKVATDCLCDVKARGFLAHAPHLWNLPVDKT